jgi:hypothetical protein
MNLLMLRHSVPLRAVQGSAVVVLLTLVSCNLSAQTNNTYNSRRQSDMLSMPAGLFSPSSGSAASNIHSAAAPGALSQRMESLANDLMGTTAAANAGAAGGNSGSAPSSPPSRRATRSVTLPRTSALHKHRNSAAGKHKKLGHSFMRRGSSGADSSKGGSGNGGSSGGSGAGGHGHGYSNGYASAADCCAVAHRAAASREEQAELMHDVARCAARLPPAAAASSSTASSSSAATDALQTGVPQLESARPLRPVKSSVPVPVVAAAAAAGGSSSTAVIGSVQGGFYFNPFGGEGKKISGSSSSGSSSSSSSSSGVVRWVVQERACVIARVSNPLAVSVEVRGYCFNTTPRRNSAAAVVVWLQH